MLQLKKHFKKIRSKSNIITEKLSQSQNRFIDLFEKKLYIEYSILIAQLIEQVMKYSINLKRLAINTHLSLLEDKAILYLNSEYKEYENKTLGSLFKEFETFFENSLIKKDLSEFIKQRNIFVHKLFENKETIDNQNQEARKICILGNKVLSELVDINEKIIDEIDREVRKKYEL